MNRLSISEIQSYIASIDLPEVSNASLAMARAEGEQSAAVSGAGLVSFVSDLSPQLRSDVLNSTLFAQLAADTKYNRITQSREWYEEYARVLSIVGWNMPTIAFKEYVARGEHFTVANAVLEILGAISSPDELAVLKVALAALADNPQNAEALTLVERRSFQDKRGSFQTLPVSESAGNAVMAIAMADFAADQQVERVLWFKWTAGTAKLFTAALRAVLSNDVYSQIRALIIEKLGSRAKEFIRDIKL